ncbi:hypothetical protein LQV63_12760 [Paenibacillus profundus]|uniref:Uncharacterized protein n=1 Tax=Paenibacillus profundus TaxID=1173085 RepID=A0ABS8YJ07_9BACL|nr:hypothetical protein [Paenibacillus profundus]
MDEAAAGIAHALITMGGMKKHGEWKTAAMDAREKSVWRMEDLRVKYACCQIRVE